MEQRLEIIPYKYGLVAVDRKAIIPRLSPFYADDTKDIYVNKWNDWKALKEEFYWYNLILFATPDIIKEFNLSGVAVLPMPEEDKWEKYREAIFDSADHKKCVCINPKPVSDHYMSFCGSCGNQTFKKLSLNQEVYHKDIYGGRELMKIIGIRENEIELEGDYSGGTHKVTQKGWMPIKGVLLQSLSQPKTPKAVIINDNKFVRYEY